VARRATPDSYFMIQDADDWAAPRRAAVLLTTLLKKNADLAVSAQPQFCEMVDGTPYQVGTRWDRIAGREDGSTFAVQTALNNRFLYRVPHHGLFRMAVLNKVGGYYGGFHVGGWDTLLTNLILMIGSVGWTPEPLYYRFLRPNSVTHSTVTGFNSAYASAVSKCLSDLYRQCYAEFVRYRAGQSSYDALVRFIQQRSRRNVTPEDKTLLASEALRLRRAMV
jgi:hypothetical protein